MMKQIFSENSPYKKRARSLAILWTLLIFFLCFLPGKDIPDVNIPFIDKWAHIILFGVFSFLWLCSAPSANLRWLLIMFVTSVFLGWLVEYIQGHYIPNRTQDIVDIAADATGGIAGIVFFVILYRRFNKNQVS